MPRLPRTEYVPTYKMYLCKFASAKPGKTVPNSAVNKTQTTVFGERLGLRARLGLAMTGRMCRIKEYVSPKPSIRVGKSMVNYRCEGSPEMVQSTGRRDKVAIRNIKSREGTISC